MEPPLRTAYNRNFLEKFRQDQPLVPHCDGTGGICFKGDGHKSIEQNAAKSKFLEKDGSAGPPPQGKFAEIRGNSRGFIAKFGACAGAETVLLYRSKPNRFNPSCTFRKKSSKKLKKSVDKGDRIWYTNKRRRERAGSSERNERGRGKRAAGDP